MQNAIDILRKYATDKKIAVAVSGGKDSMSLMHLIAHLDFIDKSNVTVVNIDHSLRENSVKESAFVKQTCEKWGLKCDSRKIDVPARRTQSGLGVEQEARNARREIFADLLKSGKTELVLTAHHRSDNAETVLMHILRGSGVGGLRGMDTLSEKGILRPLINTGRKEIDAYVKENNIPFVIDESNLDTKYTRNFVRLKIMPALEERFNAENALVTLAARAAADDDFINGFVDPKKIERAVGGGVRIRKCELKTPEPIAARYAVLMLKKMTEDYDTNSVESIVECVDLENGSRREICGGLTAISEYDHVTLYREISPVFRYPFGMGEYDCGCFTLNISPCERPERLPRGKEILRTLYVDSDKLPESAIIRPRESGDIFEPFGGGTRKLKEFFIDAKVPLRLRDRIPVIASNDAVYAVCGVEIAKPLAVADESKNILRIDIAERIK